MFHSGSSSQDSGVCGGSDVGSIASGSGGGRGGRSGAGSGGGSNGNVGSGGAGRRSGEGINSTGSSGGSGGGMARGNSGSGSSGVAIGRVRETGGGGAVPVVIGVTEILAGRFNSSQEQPAVDVTDIRDNAMLLPTDYAAVENEGTLPATEALVRATVRLVLQQLAAASERPNTSAGANALPAAQQLHISPAAVRAALAQNDLSDYRAAPSASTHVTSKMCQLLATFSVVLAIIQCKMLQVQAAQEQLQNNQQLQRQAQSGQMDRQLRWQTSQQQLWNWQMEQQKKLLAQMQQLQPLPQPQQQQLQAQVQVQPQQNPQPQQQQQRWILGRTGPLPLRLL